MKRFQLNPSSTQNLFHLALKIHLHLCNTEYVVGFPFLQIETKLTFHLHLYLQQCVNKTNFLGIFSK